MKLLAAFCAALLTAPAAMAQPPAELITYLDEIATETGTTRFGETLMGDLDDGDIATITVPVASGTTTYVQLLCNDDCNALYASAMNAAGDEIDASEDDITEPVLVIPAGSGSSIKLTLEMASCELWSCGYAVQAFVR